MKGNRFSRVSSMEDIPKGTDLLQVDHLKNTITFLSGHLRLEKFGDLIDTFKTPDMGPPQSPSSLADSEPNAKIPPQDLPSSKTVTDRQQKRTKQFQRRSRLNANDRRQRRKDSAEDSSE